MNSAAHHLHHFRSSSRHQVLYAFRNRARFKEPYQWLLMNSCPQLSVVSMDTLHLQPIFRARPERQIVFAFWWYRPFVIDGYCSCIISISQPLIWLGCATSILHYHPISTIGLCIFCFSTARLRLFNQNLASVCGFVYKKYVWLENGWGA